MTDKTLNCEICTFWQPHVGGQTGDCRKLPPQLFITDDVRDAGWPYTEKDDWCGEFESVVDPPEGVIEDGFGGQWFKRCPECGNDTMQVVRPGKVQCGDCG